MQQLQVPVLDNSICKRGYKKAGKLFSPNQFDNTIICAGHLEGKKDSCDGDSGGPLMLPVQVDRQHLFYLIGVVSFGAGKSPTHCRLSQSYIIIVKLYNYSFRLWSTKLTKWLYKRATIPWLDTRKTKIKTEKRHQCWEQSEKKQTCVQSFEKIIALCLIARLFV